MNDHDDNDDENDIYVYVFSFIMIIKIFKIFQCINFLFIVILLHVVLLIVYVRMHYCFILFLIRE